VGHDISSIASAVCAFGSFKAVHLLMREVQRFEKDAPRRGLLHFECSFMFFRSPSRFSLSSAFGRQYCEASNLGH
jgi:hypothetical protein